MLGRLLILVAEQNTAIGVIKLLGHKSLSFVAKCHRFRRAEVRRHGLDKMNSFVG